jgi:valyl-tRNA synthetase
MLSTGITPGQDLRFRWERVEQARNFANKIWNASRFVLMNLQHDEPIRSGNLDKDQLTTADRWIMYRFDVTASTVTRLLDQYDFGESGRVLYDFIWDDLCDWYIEFSKLSLYGADPVAKQRTKTVLVTVLDQSLRLLHPFMPFITEEIWTHLPVEGNTITLASWPQPQVVDEPPQEVAEMEFLMAIIRAVRNIRAEMNVPMSKKIELIVKPASLHFEHILSRNLKVIEKFCNTSSLQISAVVTPPDKAMTARVTGAELYFPLAGLIDLNQEIARLEKELNTLHGEVERIEKKLANPGFVNKAPATVIEEERSKLAEYLNKREKVQSRIIELRGE